MKRIFHFGPLPVLFCLCISIALGLPAQNATLTVQGVLKNADGTTVPDANNYTLTFKLWDDLTSGTNVWQETKTSVSIIGGIYDVVLGDGATLLTAPFDRPYYLGVSIGTGSGAEFIPRPRLTSAPYALALLGSSNIFPSSGSVGVGTKTPHASALLEVKSVNNDKGVLTPRMTKMQRDNIQTPATGLLVFQTDNTLGFYYYTGSQWQSVNESSSSAPLKVGDTYQGGIIFYLEPSGVNGLIAATVNAGMDASTYSWGCSGVNILAAHGTALGSGQANTTSIMRNSCAGSGTVAAKRAYEITLDGYSDWYLPDAEELNLMHKNLHLAGLGGFSANFHYWSSTENDATTAWRMLFNNSSATVPDTGTKNTTYRVRMIRAF